MLLRTMCPLLCLSLQKYLLRSHGLFPELMSKHYVFQANLRLRLREYAGLISRWSDLPWILAMSLCHHQCSEGYRAATCANVRSTLCSSESVINSSWRIRLSMSLRTWMSLPMCLSRWYQLTLKKVRNLACRISNVVGKSDGISLLAHLPLGVISRSETCQTISL